MGQSEHQGQGKRRRIDVPDVGRLLVIGGHEDPDEDDMVILPRLVELAGGDDAHLLVCAAPSGEPKASLRDYRTVFGKLGVGELSLFALEERPEAEDEALLEALEAATAVFFTGGDQLRIPPKVAGTAFGKRLVERYRKGLLVAGTSAGAAALSGTMIIRGEGQTVHRKGVRMAPGLGLWPHTVIDTLFDRSGRAHRVLAALAQNPGVLGLGIDEDTAVEVDPAGRFTVLGSGVVIAFDGRVTETTAAEASEDDPIALFDVALHVLRSGDAFDLLEMRPSLRDAEPSDS